MADFKPVVGIDLGVTSSRIAYINEWGKPVIIPNEENKLMTPSVVHFFDRDTVIVGDEARYMAIADPYNTVSFIQSMMGERDRKLNIHGKDYIPQEISAFILRKLKRDAESYFENQGLDVEVKDAVIAVPSYFSIEQREATKEACELAGLHLLNLIPEPIAAAMAFGVHMLSKNQTVFVFNLGGGTFDVTILEIKGNEINMIASDGDPRLGGKDWDDVLLSCCSTAFKEKYGEDPQDDSNSCQELYERVPKAKISLSKLPKAQIQVSHIGKRDNMEITREKFEDLSKHLLAQCKTHSVRVLEKVGKKWHEIDTVLLAGGSTYMPMIRNLVREMSGKEPCTDVLPDQSVALGAAYLAHEMYHPFILPLNIGLSVLNSKVEEGVAILFPKGTKLPAKCSESFGFAFDGQTGLTFKLIEGTGSNIDDYWEVGDIKVEFKLPKKHGETCDVSFSMPEYRIMKTRFKCENEEVKTEIELKDRISSSQLSDDFQRIDRFLTLARTIDTFKECHTVYDLFAINNSVLSVSLHGIR